MNEQFTDIDKPTVVHVISSARGGGAELLVREINFRLHAYNITSYLIFFESDDSLTLSGQEICLNLKSPRSIKAIPRLRSVLKLLSSKHGRLIIHTHLTWAFFYTPIAANKLPAVLIHTEHNTTNKRRNIPGFRIVDRFFYSKYLRFIAISKATASSLEKWLGGAQLPSKITTIYNGSRMFSPAQRPSINGRKLNVVSIGSLTQQKGFDLGLKAISNIVDRIECYRILGEGPQRSRLECLANELGISEKVVFEGWVDDIETYLFKSDIMLIPSRWEGFGLMAIEGMSSGLPVVAFNVDGLNEILENTPAASLCEKDDIEALSQGLLDVAKKLERDSDLMYHATSRAKKFDLEKVTSQYAKEYKSII